MPPAAVGIDSVVTGGRVPFVGYMGGHPCQELKGIKFVSFVVISLVCDDVIGYGDALHDDRPAIDMTRMEEPGIRLLREELHTSPNRESAVGPAAAAMVYS